MKYRKAIVPAVLCTALLCEGTTLPLAAQTTHPTDRIDPQSTVRASIVQTGEIGTAKWTLYSDGELEIGSGEFENKNRRFVWPWYEYRQQIKKVDGSRKFTAKGDFSRAFALGDIDLDTGIYRSAVKDIDLSGWDTSGVKKMANLFSGCYFLETLNLDGWVTDSVTDMGSMFSDCNALRTLNIGHWNTSNVTRFTSMFAGCASLTSLDLNGWDISHTDSLSYMFFNCSSLTDLKINRWNTTNVSSMWEMLTDCTRLKSLDLSGWDTSNVDVLYCMFAGCRGLESLDISSWDTRETANADFLFAGCSNLRNIRCTINTASILARHKYAERPGWYIGEDGPYTVADLPLPQDGSVVNIELRNIVMSVDMFRLYNPNNGEHFYTSDGNEKQYLIEAGWKDEGIGWIAPDMSSAPVYRLYNENAGDHHYTMDENERDYLIREGWKDEGIGWYSDDEQAVPLYRQYNPNATAGSHNYTTTLKEHTYLTENGWNDEGIAWYGMADESL